MDSMNERDRSQRTVSHIVNSALDGTTVALTENRVGSAVLSNRGAPSLVVDDAMKHPEEDREAAIMLLALCGKYTEEELDSMRKEFCPNTAIRDYQEESNVPGVKSHSNSRQGTVAPENSTDENDSSSSRYSPTTIDSGTETGSNRNSQVHRGKRSKRARCASDDSDKSYQPFGNGPPDGKRACSTESRAETICSQPIRSSIPRVSTSRIPLPKSRTPLPASEECGKISEANHEQDDGDNRDDEYNPKNPGQSLSISAPEKGKEKVVAKPNLYNNILLKKVPVGQKYTGPSLSRLVGDIFETDPSQSLALGELRCKLAEKIVNLGERCGDLPLDQSFRKTVSECCTGKGDNGRPLLKRIDGTNEGKNSNNGLYRLFVGGDELPVKKEKKKEKS